MSKRERKMLSLSKFVISPMQASEITALSYRLRPHHALCISFFEGKGYSEKFVENMLHVIKRLEGDAMVRLTMEADMICSACPNNNEQTCITYEKVRRYDRAVLSLCQLKEDQEISWKDLKEVAKDRIIRAGKLQTVCGDCQWNEICNANL